MYKATQPQKTEAETCQKVMHVGILYTSFELFEMYRWDAMNWYCFDCYLWLLQRQDHVEMEDLTVSRESLEVLTVCLMLCPPALEALNKDKSWQTFIKDLLLHCKNRYPWKKSINVFFCIYLRSTIWILILGKFYPILFLPTLPQSLVVK